MTDKKNITDDGKRKTLGLKPSTLTINRDAAQTSAATSPRIESKLKMYTNQSQGGGRNSVVVVTKSRLSTTKAEESSPAKASKDGAQTELDKKLNLLKQAEIAKQTEILRRDLIKAQREEQERIIAQAEADRLASEAAICVPAETEVVTEEVAVEEAAFPSMNRSFILQKSRIRNLDHLNRVEIEALPADVVDVVAEPELDTSDRNKFKKPIHSPAAVVDAGENEAAVPRKPDAVDKRVNKRISIAQVMMMDGEDGSEREARRFRSVAALKRAKDKARRKYDEVKEKEKIARDVLIPDVISVQELANRMAEKSADVIKTLMKLGVMVTVNQSIDADTAEIVVGELGHNFKRVTGEEIERVLINEKEDALNDLLPRPPVVTIMGHVDHGKTSLLDALRFTDVAAGEAGGITQHIGAYQVALANGKQITFLDTPGHEAFTAMRMRGAKVTDIVILVVAADDGIMEQTIEAISHAKAAQVPIIVAINKIDKPEADVDRVKMELLQHSLVPEDMGGDVIVVGVSAKQKTNLDKLEEIILLQAEVLDLRANPNRLATGVVIESKVDKGRGPVATLLIQKGVLKVGDSIVAGTAYGTIRALINDKGKHIEKALPSMPVEVLGINTVPTAGDSFLVTENEKVAKDICQHRANLEKERKQVSSRRSTLEQLFMKSGKEGVKELPVIVKGDVQGSVEAICNSLLKLATDEVNVNILHSAAGGITESDVTLAIASGAVILGFNVRANNQARDAAKNNGVDMRYYSIIYNLVDDVKAAMSGMLSPIMKEEYLGSADIKQVFDLTKFGKVAGCYITDGIAKRNCKARLIRDSVVIHDGRIKALKRFKEDLREVKSGFECGVSFENYEDMKVNDKIEFYEVTEEARQL